MKWAGSWLAGPQAATADRGRPDGYPGAQWEFPRSGPGSVATPGRRFAGVILDALMSWAVAEFITRNRTPDGLPLPGWWSSVVFAVECILFLTLAGQTAGMRLVGLRVRRLDGREVGPLTAVVRTALLFLLIPALFSDRDYRTLHDRATGTVVIRT